VKVGTQAGSLQVFGTNACGDGTPRTKSVNPTCITGITEEAAITSIKVYPNPFNTQFNIEFEASGSNEPVVLTLYDITGRLVRFSTESTVSGTNKVTIDMAQEAAGMYILNLQQGTYSSRFRLVKE
jgi:hypothetical protein